MDMITFTSNLAAAIDMISGVDSATVISSNEIGVDCHEGEQYVIVISPA